MALFTVFPYDWKFFLRLEKNNLYKYTLKCYLNKISDIMKLQ